MKLKIEKAAPSLRPFIVIWEGVPDNDAYFGTMAEAEAFVKGAELVYKYYSLGDDD